ncbi:hypothetical protein [Nonomuraea sp. LPB2021202275-12-8]|uniref:hypothetical protein n=1 Tax=Nonomuraea sp. LPB2021202275-12-8 TaxID=3120159 RepID=UPI00300C86A8
MSPSTRWGSSEHVRGFAAMMTGRNGHLLDDWIATIAAGSSPRPGRYTILEHLDQTESELAGHVKAYVKAVAG